MKRLTMAAVLVCALAAPAAADLADGLAAYERADYAAALAVLTPLAQAGDADAQLRLGRMFYAGLGVAQDFVTAAAWLQKAAAAGVGEAQDGLGRLYYSGEGVPQDFAEAARLFRSAAMLGVAAAMDDLAGIYLRGEGVPQDFAEAARWYLAGAERGRAEAQYSHGLMYYDGRGVPQDYAEALRWFRRAAAQRLGGAMSIIGEMYRLGRGVRRDPVRAYAWFNLGTALAPAPARVLAVLARDRAAETLSPQDLARGQRLARALHARIVVLAEGARPPSEADLAALTQGADGAAAEIAAVEPPPPFDALTLAPEADAPVREPADEEIVTAAPAEPVVVAAIEESPATPVAPADAAEIAAAAEGPAPAPEVLAPAPERPLDEEIAAAAPATADLAAAEPDVDVALAGTGGEDYAAEPAQQPQDLQGEAEARGEAAPVSPGESAEVVSAEPVESPPAEAVSDVAVAGLDAGLAAYRALDYWRAATVWRPLAQQGDARAQRRLGQLYFDGTGVPMNPVQAYFWWTLAARQGDDEAHALLAGATPGRAPDALLVARLLADSWSPAR